MLKAYELWVDHEFTKHSKNIASKSIPLTEPGFSVHGRFSGDPGHFELCLQVASVDMDDDFQTIANGVMSTTDPTSHTFHFDADGKIIVRALFARLLMRHVSEDVSLTARLIK
jgi:hypothetical protein